jgi:hypothetical protein
MVYEINSDRSLCSRRSSKRIVQQFSPIPDRGQGRPLVGEWPSDLIQISKENSMAKRRPRPKGRQFLTANSLDVWVSPFPNIVIDCIYSSSDITAERAVFPQSPREQGQFRVAVGLALRIFAFHRLTSYFEHQKFVLRAPSWPRRRRSAKYLRKAARAWKKRPLAAVKEMSRIFAVSLMVSS